MTNPAASNTDNVTMPPGVLGWTARRGPITTPGELIAAVRAGETVHPADDAHVIAAVEGHAPLVAVVRIDHDVAALVRQVTDLTLQVDDLHNRLVDITETAVETLARR
jgi:hypothetical protein